LGLDQASTSAPEPQKKKKDAQKDERRDSREEEGSRSKRNRRSLKYCN